MGKYTIIYGRTVQIRPYESLHIELIYEFDTELTSRQDGYKYIRDTVNKDIEEERKLL